MAVSASQNSENNIKKPKYAEPPLVNLKIANPVTYLRLWWKKVMSKEGVDFRFRIHPVTALIIAIVIISASLGLDRLYLLSNFPFAKYILSPTPTPNFKVPSPTPDPWRQTAFTGTLQYADAINRFYLLTQSSEAIGLDVPTNVELSNYVGKRIFAAGNYNKITRTLVVANVSDFEVLPSKAITIPTTQPSLFPTQIPSLIPTIIPSTEPTINAPGPMDIKY